MISQEGQFSNRPRPWSSLGKQYLQFSKNDLSWFNRIFLLFAARKSCAFQIFLLRSIKAYLCANITNFDIVDFSGRRPEEVISFFWRLVYIEWNENEIYPLCFCFEQNFILEMN